MAVRPNRVQNSNLIVAFCSFFLLPLTIQPENRGESAEVEIRAMAFQEIAPDTSTEDEVIQILGDAVTRRNQNGKSYWEYGPNSLYSKVELVLDKGVVHSIILHLESPSTVAEVVRELDLKSIRPATVRSPSGQPIGLTYPERGVLLSYAEAAMPPRVSHVILEAISGDTFALRALDDVHYRYSENLRDLDVAIRLDDQHAEAHWLRGRVRKNLGDYTAALSDIESAVRLDSSRTKYRLLRAELLYLTGEVDRALRETRSIISRSDETELDAAAECLLGDLILGGPKRDPKLALEHHQKAVQLASQLLGDSDRTIRRSGREILIRAYLGAANDIALGTFSNKKEMVPRWVDNALKIVRETEDRDRADPGEVIWARQHALTALNAMGGSNQADAIIEELFDAGRERIADAQDSLYQQSIEWMLGEAIAEAAHYEYEQGNTEQVLTYANNAVAILEPLAENRPVSRQRDYLLAKAFYFVGSAHAVKSRDYREAVVWYQKAAPYLPTPAPANRIDDVGMLGERLVSMGVAYWELDDLANALQYTKEGVRLMDQAVKHGLLSKGSLAIPYSNLAAMYEAQGKFNEAKTLADMARRLNPPSNQRKP